MNNIEQESNIDNDELIILLNDIYNWHNGDGDIDKNSTFYKFYKNHSDEFTSIYDLEKEVIREGNYRFKNIVKLLFASSPYNYIK